MLASTEGALSYLLLDIYMYVGHLLFITISAWKKTTRTCSVCSKDGSSLICALSFENTLIHMLYTGKVCATFAYHL